MAIHNPKYLKPVTVSHSYNKEWIFFQCGRVTASSKNRYPATTTKAHLLVTVWDYFSVVWLCLKHSGRSGYPSIQYTLYPLETSFYTPLDTSKNNPFFFLAWRNTFALDYGELSQTIPSITLFMLSWLFSAWNFTWPESFLSFSLDQW